MGVRIYGRLRKGVGVSMPLAGVVKGFAAILGLVLGAVLGGVKGVGIAFVAWIVLFGRKRRRGGMS